MSKLIRGCTADFTFTFDFELSSISKLTCVFTQKGILPGKTITKTLSDFTQTTADKKLSITLTQSETLNFRPGEALLIQFKILFTTGKARTSQVMFINVDGALDEEVLS